MCETHLVTVSMVIVRLVLPTGCYSETSRRHRRNHFPHKTPKIYLLCPWVTLQSALCITSSGEFLNILKIILAATVHALFHLTRFPTHIVETSFLTGTPNCVPWRKPFVVPVSGLLLRKRRTLRLE